MYYIHFRANHESDFIYESGIVYHPFLKELNINKPLAFTCHDEEVKDCITELNDFINKYPEIAGKTFCLGHYSVEYVPDSLVRKETYNKTLSANQTLEVCIFIFNKINEAEKAKNDLTQFHINTLRKISDELKDDDIV